MQCFETEGFFILPLLLYTCKNRVADFDQLATLPPEGTTHFEALSENRLVYFIRNFTYLVAHKDGIHGKKSSNC